MMHQEKHGCQWYWVPDKPDRPLRPWNCDPKMGHKLYAPGHPEIKNEIYTSEEDFIEKQTQLRKKFHQPVVYFTGPDGRKRVRHNPLRPVTSECWKRYQIQQRRLESMVANESDSESSDSVDACAVGLNHPLLEEKADNTNNNNTVTNPVVEVPPPAGSGLNNTLLDAQVPEIKHDDDVAPKGEVVVEGEDEILEMAAKKKAKKTRDKRKRKSSVLSPGRISMKKMKMGRKLEGKKAVVLVKRVIEEVSSMEKAFKRFKILKRKLKSYL